MLNAIFLMLGAALWATDTLFRHPMAQQVSAISIVFLEHAFALAISALAVFIFKREKLKLSIAGISGAMAVGVVGSALATVLFTSSFRYVNPSVSILLQKTQPIVVLLLSWIFLGEKLSIRFFLWALVAMAAAFFLSFPHGISRSDFENANFSGIALALTASFFWAISTVIGKNTLKAMPSSQLTLWRFFFGFLALWVLLYFVPASRIEIPFLTSDPEVMRSIFFMAVIPGFLGVTLYYRGLTRLKASVATLLELTFPLCALYVNSRYLGFHLENSQLIASGILIFAIFKISRT